MDFPEICFEMRGLFLERRINTSVSSNQCHRQLPFPKQFVKGFGVRDFVI